MSIHDTNIGPLLKLNLPSPEEYRKRKVALISGLSPPAARPDVG